ncbi:hypothetical protein NBRC10512_006513 [Rhodotorula toruloides]|uniref:RHTO0S01e03862g1_1 n=2 Tax=Rhodotorula toruloides TaxID=5286 RepID=A0A061AER8_RHOTO|nr:uncharacterized protein RHTO_01516 [Rhodotorula toruloides NP11]EMS21869.1 hypothetical protein RHTO_01516 [Rhodotorula toruloides NP11]CDR35640.1 RHTO0S01e03862g1_1 [Rhodotorula toruloides]
MPPAFGPSAMDARVGDLFPKNQKPVFGKTQQAREWKQGVMSVTSSEWLIQLKTTEYCDGRVKDLQERLKLDAHRVQAASGNLSFFDFVDMLLGKQDYDQLIKLGPDGPKQLGIEYGRVLVDVCQGPPSVILDAWLNSLEAFVRSPHPSESSAHELGEILKTWPKVSQDWPYLRSAERSRIISRCEHALRHLQQYKEGGTSPDELVHHVPTGSTLLGQRPLIAWHPEVHKCATCAEEYRQVSHSLAHSATSPFAPQARATVARQMRTF